MISTDIQPQSSNDASDLRDAKASLVNVPNTLSAVRLALSLAMIAIALTEHRVLFLVVFLAAASTDWIDGKLATWLEQRTALGAVLDSIADASMYGALLFGCIWLEADTLWNESGWIVLALFSYVANIAAAAIKFRRLPSYHTYAAKAVWLITTLAAVALLADWFIWPLRVAAIGVALANLEALLITLLLDRWRVDVRSLWHVAAEQRG